MREAVLEKYVCDKIRQRGGRCFKWNCPGVTGVPDRIAIFPGGRVVFLELKRPGLKDGLSERQKKMFRVLEGLGCTVRRISEKSEFWNLIKEFEEGDAR
jgi:hypothetical protein